MKNFLRFFVAMGGLLLLLAATSLRADPYYWDHPNTDPYRGSIEHALAGSGWPLHVQQAILLNRQYCRYERIPPSFHFEWMWFGDAQAGRAYVRRDVVARTQLWPRGVSRETLVCRFEDRLTMREYVLFVPKACNNVSGYSRPILFCVCPPEAPVCPKH